eukprot:506374-Rhodomonas_salina.3
MSVPAICTTARDVSANHLYHCTDCQYETRGLWCTWDAGMPVGDVRRRGNGCHVLCHEGGTCSVSAAHSAGRIVPQCYTTCPIQRVRYNVTDNVTDHVGRMQTVVRCERAERGRRRGELDPGAVDAR